MQRTLAEYPFYQTYYYANVIRNILHDRTPYLRNLDAFYGDDGYQYLLPPFRKFSAFHSFIEFIVSDFINEDIGNVDLKSRQDKLTQFKSFSSVIEELRLLALPINKALQYYGITHTSFADWLTEHEMNLSDALEADVDAYHEELMLEGTIERLIDIIVKEVFFLLFQNRGLLLLFNEMMAEQIYDGDLESIEIENQLYFEKKGYLKRVAIPTWVKKAVYFRDRGLCSICHRDLSGILNIGSVDNFDHIVPLARGGMNDVTNIQLLCEECNREKSDGEALTSHKYEEWYSME